MEFGLDVIRHKARHGLALSPFERHMSERAAKLGQHELGSLLKPLVERSRTIVHERDLHAGLAANGIKPTITVIDGPCTVAQARFRFPDLSPTAAGAWSLYGMNRE